MAKELPDISSYIHAERNKSSEIKITLPGLRLFQVGGM
jgi:hypothetical protein